jgi:capsular exopolysaccharide synthesis family protein
MSLSDVFSILRRYLALIVGVALLGCGIAFAFSLTRHASYSATATLRLATVSSSGGGGLSPDLAYTDRLANTYRAVVASAPFGSAVRRRLGLAAAPRISASIPANTELIRISATASDADGAARIANASAQQLISRAQAFATANTQAEQAALRAHLQTAAAQLAAARRLAADPRSTPEARAIARGTVTVREEGFLGLQNQYDEATSPTRRPYLSVIEQASSAGSPNFPSPRTIPIIGLLLGMLAGIALAFSADRRDTRLRSGAAVTSAGDTPILGRVPHMSRATARNGRKNRDLIEPFRRIRTTLFALAEPPAPPDSFTLLVTSPGEGEGRTTIAANLAMAIARGNHRVLLVDADMRSPGVHRAFAIDNGLGLQDVLAGRATVDEAVRNTSLVRLGVLVAGQRPDDDSDTFANERFAAIVPQLGQRFDVVVIDAPPLLGATDAAILAPLVDGVVLVVRSRRTRGEALREAQETLTLLRASLLGVVVNDASDEFAMTGAAATGMVS